MVDCVVWPCHRDKLRSHQRLCASRDFAFFPEGIANQWLLAMPCIPEGWQYPRGEQCNVSQGDGRVTVASSNFEGMTMPGHVYLGHVGSESVLNDMRSRPLPEGVIRGYDGEQCVQLVCMIASTKLYFIIYCIRIYC